MKILSIVGARPEFIQAAPVSRALRKEHKEILVHTGQHYDQQMSAAFFQELTLPTPKYNLAVGSGSQNQQTARVMVRLEEVLEEEQPDLVLVRGDTNSTLGSAIAASKLGFPLAHIEAGERSYNSDMPEEVNRLVVDQLSDIHFCASHNAVNQLAGEGIVSSSHWVGDVMYDSMIYYHPVAQRRSHILSRLELTPGRFCLVTIHRVSNTADFRRLERIISALNQLNEIIVLPLHPRTRKALGSMSAQFGDHVRVIDPVGYLDMIMLEDGARLIATDSGGVQREAYFLGRPCLTLRDETEWVETVETGWNQLVGTETERLLNAWEHFEPPAQHPPIFGDGKASERIVEILSGPQEPIHVQASLFDGYRDFAGRGMAH